MSSVKYQVVTTERVSIPLLVTTVISLAALSWFVYYWHTKVAAYDQESLELAHAIYNDPISITGKVVNAIEKRARDQLSAEAAAVRRSHLDFMNEQNDKMKASGCNVQIMNDREYVWRFATDDAPIMDAGVQSASANGTTSAGDNLPNAMTDAARSDIDRAKGVYEDIRKMLEMSDIKLSAGSRSALDRITAKAQKVAQQIAAELNPHEEVVDAKSPAVVKLASVAGASQHERESLARFRRQNQAIIG